MTMSSSCQLVICGDICPTADTQELFLSGNATELFKGAIARFRQSDLLIGNLECPLNDGGKGIAKSGPVLAAPTASIKALKSAGFDVLAMANNHIRDRGDDGVLSSLKSCREQGILTVGAGADADTAKKPIVVDIKGWKIGVLAFAEHEFNAASKVRAGANLFDLFESFDEIRALHRRCDYLIVLYHGGIEQYQYPSPLLQKKCRKMVESGADLVLCQHSHCVGTLETYGSGAIVYGQGNTVFGYRERMPGWNDGLIVCVELTRDKETNAEIEYIPISAGLGGIDLMPLDRRQTFLNALHERSKKAKDGRFLEESWRRFCADRRDHYLPLLLGLGRPANFANRRLGNRLVQSFYSKTRMRIIMNLMRCEAHHEVVQTLLEAYVEDDHDRTA